MHSPRPLQKETTCRRRGVRAEPVARGAKKILRGAILLAALTWAASVGSARAEDQLTPVLAGVLATPAAVPQTDGSWKLPYEIELTNATGGSMSIESVEVIDPDHDRAVVASLSGADVAANLSLPGSNDTATLGPAQTAVLFIQPSFSEREDVPKRLVHRIVASSEPGTRPGRTVEEVAAVSVDPHDPIVVGPPLRGDRWVAAASCCRSYHRRAVLPVNGSRHLAQRFAIDWVQVGPEGRLATGDPASNQGFPQYGAEAIAVRDATVAHVQDGLPEGRPGSFPEEVTATTADGNSVILDLGDGRFALYAHLQPGSVRVRPGDHVDRGDVLGLVGSSGNSDAPHLHFHVMDSPSPLASNGLPYVIDAFDVRGRVVSASDLNDELKKAATPVRIVPVEGAGTERHENELPSNLDLIRFPD